VEYYDFEVLRGEEVIAAERSVPLTSSKAAWPKIIKLAKGLNVTRCRIRVKERGETIILIGAAVALLYSDFDFSAAAWLDRSRRTNIVGIRRVLEGKTSPWFEDRKRKSRGALSSLQFPLIPGARWRFWAAPAPAALIAPGVSVPSFIRPSRLGVTQRSDELAAHIGEED
jgi:hypothetical protein